MGQILRLIFGVLHLEVEGLAQAGGVGGATRGGDAGLGHRKARRVVGVQEGAPPAVDGVDPVAVEQGVGAVLGQRPPRDLRGRPVGGGQVLDHADGHVNAEAVL